VKPFTGKKKDLGLRVLRFIRKMLDHSPIGGGKFRGRKGLGQHYRNSGHLTGDHLGDGNREGGSWRKREGEGKEGHSSPPTGGENDDAIGRSHVSRRNVTVGAPREGGGEERRGFVGK